MAAMVYFFINIPHDEVQKLEKMLPKGSYCLFQVQSGSTRYYGMLKEEAYQTLMTVLSPETSQHVELLDKTVFQHFFLQNISDQIYCLGNRRLMLHLSDEN